MFARFVLFACLVLAAPAAWAGSVETLKPHQAWAKVREGEIVLLDVRTQAEWQQTGVPEKAARVTLDDPRGTDGFISGARKAVRGDLKTPVGVICRTGSRSAKAAALLAQAGFKTVYDVSEGVLGDGRTTGWATRGLPMVACGNCYLQN